MIAEHAENMEGKSVTRERARNHSVKRDYRTPSADKTLEKGFGVKLTAYKERGFYRNFKVNSISWQF